MLRLPVPGFSLLSFTSRSRNSPPRASTCSLKDGQIAKDWNNRKRSNFGQGIISLKLEVSLHFFLMAKYQTLESSVGLLQLLAICD